MKMQHVLIVDDKEENLYLLRTLLQGNGYKVVTAIHGVDALEKARQNPPDMIIADILMPVMDGFALCREWKKDGRLKRIPFVFYTATYTDERDREFAISLGAERFIVKPQEPDVFLSLIQETIQQVGSQRAEQARPAAKAPTRLPVEAPEEKNAVYLKQYNETLIRKLETKMEQLEKTNRELEQGIARRKQAEAEQARLAAIVNSSDDAIIGKTLDGIITSWNQGAEKIFGYSAAEALGKPMPMLFPPGRVNEEKELLARIGCGEGVTHFETVRVRKDGKHIDVSVTLSPITGDGGKIVGVSKIARDITQRKQLEEQFRQSQKMDAIGQLAGGVAHDFNNILAVIQMQADLLKTDENPSPSQLETARDIGAAAQRAAALTRQLLLFSRKGTMQAHDLDLNESIHNMTKMLRRILGEDIQTQFNFALQPVFIHADPGMMDQVLVNLAVNSRDAMPKGGKLIIETAVVEFDELAASQSPQARSGSYVCLSVSDTGCGIPAQNLPRIFEPFFTTKDIGKGTGLGLATVHGIVQQHRGWINVYSEVGCGTTFRVYIPRLAEMAAQKAGEAALKSMPGGNETILLVEDDASVRISLHKVLTQLGYQVIQAVNGLDALGAWKLHRNEIRLLLTDLVMPEGMNGRELTEKLLKDKPGLKVIYTSGYSDEIAGGGGDFQLEEGVNFLSKPFQAHKLARIIRARLDG